MKALLKALLPLLDVLLSPMVTAAACLMWLVRRIGVARLPLSKSVLLKIGVFPIRNHYYEPLFDARHLRHDLDRERNLAGIQWNVRGQLDLLDRFSNGHELAGVPAMSSGPGQFHMNNGMFEAGDAEYLYQLIRHVKPRRFFEIGSGYSTLMAACALSRNASEVAGYSFEHRCYEPYESHWLERPGLKVLRQRVEECDPSEFTALGAGDILFIDSSHVIRPQGDVLFECLEILPLLRPGVIVHFHDVFSPRDYPARWVVDDVYLWNEQYLLEAFLMQNMHWRVIGALNYLSRNHFDQLKAKCPYLEATSVPRSFYIERVC